MKKLSLKTYLATAAMFMASSAWATDVVVPTPVYFNDFSFAVSGQDGIEIVGNGVFENDADERFGKIFHNDPGDTPTKAIRTNYLKLPDNVLSHSAETKEITIGFWVNVKNAANYWYSPIFSAYGMSPADNEADFAWDNNTGTKSTTVHREGNNENWPIFVMQSRGLMQVNNGGYDNFEGTDNVKGTNTENTYWLDDDKWHYFTMTMSTTSAKIYIDGDIFNEWNINGTEGHYVEGFFTYGSSYRYICLGGNQAFNWDDPDPAYSFDDFAVYNKVLSKEQIDQIINNKLYRIQTGTKIGAVDNSNDYLTASTTKITLNPGEIYHYQFTNYNNGTTNWNNWILPVYNESDERVITVRADNYEDMHHVGETWGSNAGCTSNFNWANFPGELNGAWVDMYVTFTEEKVFKMTSTINTVSGLTWTYDYTNDYESSPIDLTSLNSIKVALSVSRSRLELFKEEPVVKKHVSSAGWATICSNKDLDFSKHIEGLEAYIITGHTGSTLTLDRIEEETESNQGFLLKAAEGDYYIPVVADHESAMQFIDNLLEGNLTETVKEANSIYVLMDETKGVGFYKNNKSFTVGANTAYLPAESMSGAAPAFLGFFDSETTGIESVKQNTAAFGDFFDMQGRRVAKPAKGLYIMNGKKVVIK